jgi:hypothetical protein
VGALLTVAVMAVRDGVVQPFAMTQRNRLWWRRGVVNVVPVASCSASGNVIPIDCSCGGYCSKVAVPEMQTEPGVVVVIEEMVLW